MAKQIGANISSTSSNTKPAGTLRGGFMIVLVVKPACPKKKFDLILKTADEQGLPIYNKTNPNKNTLIFLQEDSMRPGFFPFEFSKEVEYDPEHFMVQIQSSRELWGGEDGTVSRVAIADLEGNTVKPFASEDAISPQHREVGVLSRHGSTAGLVIITSITAKQCSHPVRQPNLRKLCILLETSFQDTDRYDLSVNYTAYHPDWF